MPQRPLPVGPSPQALVACAGARLAETCSELAAGGARLLTLFGADERGGAGEFAIYAAFLAPDGQTLTVRASVDAQQPEYPSVTPLLQAVHWDERELADLLGVVPAGHPDPRPLVRRPDWPAGSSRSGRTSTRQRFRLHRENSKASYRVRSKGRAWSKCPWGRSTPA